MLTEARPSQQAARRAASAAVLPSCAVAVASDGCVVVPLQSTQRRMWLGRLPVRALFDGAVITCSRAVIYHVLLGLSFEAAIGAIPSLDFSLDL